MGSGGCLAEGSAWCFRARPRGGGFPSSLGGSHVKGGSWPWFLWLSLHRILPLPWGTLRPLDQGSPIQPIQNRATEVSGMCTYTVLFACATGGLASAHTRSSICASIGRTYLPLTQMETCARPPLTRNHPLSAALLVCKVGKMADHCLRRISSCNRCLSSQAGPSLPSSPTRAGTVPALPRGPLQGQRRLSLVVSSASL